MKLSQLSGIVLIFSSLLLIIAAETEEEKNTNVTPKPNNDDTESVVPPPKKSKPFFNLGVNWPYMFNDDSKKADHDIFEDVITKASRLWGTIGGFINLVKNPNGGKNNNKTVSGTGDY